MNRLLPSPFLSLVLLLFSGSSLAIWGGVLPPLEESDIEIIKQKAREELSHHPIGTTLHWKNPATRAYGSVTLINRYWVGQKECRRIRHHINVRQKSPWDQAITLCRHTDGTWHWE